MAKVATGQKLDRLPPGKIFGMSVTEPNSTQLSTPNNPPQPIDDKSSNSLENQSKTEDKKPEKKEVNY